MTIETATETIKVPPWLENQGALEMESAKSIASRTSLGYTKSTSVNSVTVDIKEVVQMAKERFMIEPHQMNRSLYRALGVAPRTINDFIDDLEHEMHLVPKTKIHVKECSVEDIIRSLTENT